MNKQVRPSYVEFPHWMPWMQKDNEFLSKANLAARVMHLKRQLRETEIAGFRSMVFGVAYGFLAGCIFAGLICHFWGLHR